ncbi:MAG: hypothetical protein ACK46X_19685 [Candidatus Sericytochromatia bacterium]
MRLVSVVLLSALCLSACQLAGPAGTSGAKRASATPSPKKPATPAPAKVEALEAVGNGALSKANKDSLVRSLHNALAATRASRVSATLNEASGIIANDGAGVLSDNGLGVISNNGAGVVSNGAAGFRLLAKGDVDFTSETTDLVYHFQYKNFSAPAPRNGSMRIYEKAGFKSSVPGDREKALLDHYEWPDMGMTLGHGGEPLHAAISFPMTKVSSRRLPFADKMLTRRVLRLKSLTSTKAEDRTDIGWEYEFDLAVAFLGGETDTASFKAIAGEKDLMMLPTSRGTEQSLPARLVVTGKNATGTYAGEADCVKHRADITHTATDGLKTRAVLVTAPGEPSRLEVESLTTGFTIKAALTPEGGEGELLAKGEKVGTLRHDAQGVATITFKDGTSVKAQLF